MPERQEEVAEILEIDCVPRQLLSPSNYLEFGFYLGVPPSPQFSSGFNFSLWDFSDCINGNSTGDKQLAIIPQPSYDHDSFQEGFDNRGESPWIPPIQGQTPSDNIEPKCTSGRLCKRVIAALHFFSNMINKDALAQIRVPVKNGSQYVLRTSEHLFVLNSQRADLEIDGMISLRYVFRTDSMDDKEVRLSYGMLGSKLNERAVNIQYYSSTEYQQLDHADPCNNKGGLWALTISELSEGLYVGVLEFSMTSQLLYYATKSKIFRKILEALALKYQTNRFRLRLEHLQNEEEMEKTDSVEQQSVLKFDSVYDGRKISDSQGKNPDTTLKRSRDRITLEDLQQHFGLPLNDAAERLGISRSTLKRLCRQHDISRWPSHKRKRDNGEQNIELEKKSVQEAERVLLHTSQSCGLLAGSVDKSTLHTQNLVSQQREGSVEAPQYVQHETPVGGNTIENIDTPEKTRTSHPLRAKDRVLESINTIPPGSSQPGNQVVACFPSTNPKTRVAAMQDTGKITIKARYMDVIIKFPLSSSSGIAELQKEVIKRLKLSIGTFTIKYLDSDQDWVLIACDEDLQFCVSTGTGEIQMSIQSNLLG